MGVNVASRFNAVIATGPDWGQTAKACLDRLGDTGDANFGFLYVSDALADDAGSIITLLRAVTGIRDWVGSVGIGVCAGEEELFGQPAVAVMTARLAPDSFRVFPTITAELDTFRDATGGWLSQAGPVLGLVHGDPRNPHIPDLIARLADTAGGFLVGGLTSSRSVYSQIATSPIAGLATGGAVTTGGLSGVLFDSSVPVATGLTQGCAPIGPVRIVTACEENVIKEIDGRRALDVFKEDIGDRLARDLRQVAGTIFAALPIRGSDTGDYLVRNLAGIDPRQGWLAIGEVVEPGQPVRFTRRDRSSALADLDRMLRGLKRRVTGEPRGAIYVSCIARGPNLFGEGGQELKLIRRAIGDVPLVGFFANGEISHNRLYGYTGVLTLFL